MVTSRHHSDTSPLPLLFVVISMVGATFLVGFLPGHAGAHEATQAEDRFDPAWGEDGRAVIGEGVQHGYVDDIAVDASGRVLIALSGDSTSVLRLLEDGSLDPAFGDGGRVDLVDDYDHDGAVVAIDSEDRVLLAHGTSLDYLEPGEWRVSVTRLLPNGALDSTFGENGTATSSVFPDYAEEWEWTIPKFTNAGGIVVDSQDRVVVSVFSLMFRFLPTGDPDPNFGDDGVIQFPHTPAVDDCPFPVEVVAAVAGDKLLHTITDPDCSLVGGSTWLSRLQPDGQPDSSFAANQIFGAAVADDGSIYGLTDPNDHSVPTNEPLTIHRYHPNGELDPGFEYPVNDDRPISRQDTIDVDDQGRVVSGWVGQFETSLLRLQPDGSPDGSNGPQGIFDFPADLEYQNGIEIAIDHENRILVAGSSRGDLVVDRLLASGVPENPFTDDDDSVFEDDIEAIAARGITYGCNPPENTLFCPEDDVTRGEMAAFLTRALDLPDLPESDRFTDDDSSIFENDIEAIAAAGITYGCNPPDNTEFCPDDNVMRQEMASFLTRAYGFVDDDPDADRFADDDGNVHEADIEALASAGVTYGCNPPDNTLYCPDDSVSRGQMAAFLNRAHQTD